ncbi:PepSY domain-containing protein [Sphingomonas sinipercae]|uniref:PepSY domain-containing protein n=1 Tax=Sphingomonas sinipercae TaxID=2714944 RepID=A0A6G7ZQI5_9SPHN|nr:PepSY domain-containing protein [Sphingomonas sinipercae]QIL03189.1 PepSY domain-containing protein [Sphingomonas sinipercae]
MRKWHRWLAVLFGVFLLWISATGVLSQVGSLVNKANAPSQAQAAAAATPPGFECPATMTCRPKPKPGGWNVGLLHHLHSGESFGPAGTAISILSGFALFFFSFSGLWMYVQMWRGRLARVESGKTVRGDRLFW